MTGPSLLVHHFHKVSVLYPSESDEDQQYLLWEPLSWGEKQAIYGYVEHYDSEPHTILPMDKMLQKFFCCTYKDGCPNAWI